MEFVGLETRFYKISVMIVLQKNTFVTENLLYMVLQKKNLLVKIGQGKNICL